MAAEAGQSMDAKQEVRDLLDRLPDDVTLEDVPCRVYVYWRLRQKMAPIEARRAVPHENEVANEFREKWLRSEKTRRPQSANGRRLMDAKEEVHELLDSLPDDVTLEDMLYELYVYVKVQQGLASAESEPLIPHEEVASEVQKWLRRAG
jgi:hypothetical protein